jgi:hypothetical protein
MTAAMAPNQVSEGTDRIVARLLKKGLEYFLV